MQHPMDPSLESQDPDESRPAKRVRLEAPLDITEDVQDEIVDDEDWDDIYATSDAVEGAQPSATEEVLGTALPGEQDVPDLEEPDVQDPTSEVAEPASIGSLPLAPTGESAHLNGVEEEEGMREVEDGVPAEAIDQGDDLIVEQHSAPVPSADDASMRMVEETSGINGDPAARIERLDGQTNGSGEHVQPVEDATSASAGGVGLSEAPDEQPEPSTANGHAEASVTEPTEDATRGLLDLLDPPNGNAKPSPGTDEPQVVVTKPTEDPEFMAAAAAQTQEPNAEWNFDPSDAESSSDSDSSDSSDSDSDSEDAYELLDPATAARILMAGEGDDDDGEGKKGKGGGGGADHQPRTANEKKETVIPKPDVAITEDTKITELGHVERAVGNMLLIKGSTPGEYQVLESGSVLCNSHREVIGAVAETLGRVQEPMYSVAFTNAQEIEAAGLGEYGAKVFYVDAHSTFVFTQPLKNLRGTDASNIHDEEVAEDEMEFSDDEAEAEWKRLKKFAKKAARGGGFDNSRGGGRGGGATRNFGAPGGNDNGAPASSYVGNGIGNGIGNIGYAGDAPEQFYGGGMRYDDDDEPGEEFYSPLKRPDNLSQMMAAGGPPLPKLQHAGGDRGGRGGRGGRGDRGRGGRGDRGGGRGRGRGGGDREGGQRGGRGGGGGEQRGGRGGGFGQDREQRGGRGGQANGTHRGNAQSFPDRHNNDHHRPNGGAAGGPQHSLPPKPTTVPQTSPPPVAQQQQYPAQAYGQYTQQQQQPQQAQAAATPQSYQFNGYTFQYGTTPQAQQQQQQGYYAQHQHQQPAATAPPPPAGAYVNPAFYHNQNQQQQNQQQQQQQQQWTPQQIAQWTAQQQQQQAAAAAAYAGWSGQQQQYAAQPGGGHGQGYGQQGGTAAASQGYGNFQPAGAAGTSNSAYGGGGVSAAQQQQNLADILRRIGGAPQ